MDGNQMLRLGLGIEPPWKLVVQRLDMDKQSHELRWKCGHFQWL